MVEKEVEVEVEVEVAELFSNDEPELASIEKSNVGGARPIGIKRVEVNEDAVTEQFYDKKAVKMVKPQKPVTKTKNPVEVKERKVIITNKRAV